MVDRIVLGKWGEDLAARHLEATGYEVLARNWRCAAGEIDIVARNGDGIVFVEVKTRSGYGFGEPASAVTETKIRRLHRLAGRWLAECHPPGWHDLRFDVISVVRRPGVAPELEHLEGVF